MRHKRSVNLSKISVIVEQSESLRKPQLQSIKTDLRRQKQQETESAVQQIRESRSPSTKAKNDGSTWRERLIVVVVGIAIKRSRLQFKQRRIS